MTARAADVLVIGAGASGAVVCHHLARAGFKVTCLEQGRWWNASEFPGGRPGYDLAVGGPFSPNPNRRGLDEDYPCVVDESDVHPLMGNAVGGSTVHYSAIWTRARPDDLRLRSRAGFGDDWPVDYHELVPYYEAVERAIGVSGLGGNPAYPPGAPPPLPAFPIGRAGRRMGAAMNELGWHWWPAWNAMRSRAYGRLDPCVRRGTCDGGCPEGGKGSMDVSLWPEAIGAGARLVTGARVCEVLVDVRGRATGARYVDRDGREHVAHADVVVLAANGIGTPRLLLLSRSTAFPDGLANRSGLVGKRLMLHPYGSVIGVYDERLGSERGPHGASIVSHQFAGSDAARGYVGSSHWELTPRGGPSGCLTAAGHRQRPVAERFGAGFHVGLEEAWDRVVAWGFSCEDLPEAGNEIVLDDAVTDSDGLPAPRLRYRIADNTRRNIAFQVERASEAHLAAGATRVRYSPNYPECGWHLLGTARMGEDPATSVVDRQGRSHDVPNLYVVDGSAFVTAGAVNPTATICALALRSAHNIAAG